MERFVFWVIVSAACILIALSPDHVRPETPIALLAVALGGFMAAVVCLFAAFDARHHERAMRLFADSGTSAAFAMIALAWMLWRSSELPFLRTIAIIIFVFGLGTAFGAAFLDREMPKPFFARLIASVPLFAVFIGARMGGFELEQAIGAVFIASLAEMSAFGANPVEAAETA